MTNLDIRFNLTPTSMSDPADDLLAAMGRTQVRLDKQPKPVQKRAAPSNPKLLPAAVFIDPCLAYWF